jgi:hypothetical protein
MLNIFNIHLYLLIYNNSFNIYNECIWKKKTQYSSLDRTCYKKESALKEKKCLK